MSIKTKLALILLPCLMTVTSMAEAQTSDPSSIEFFESKIRPVLARECYGCHSQQTGQAKGGLKLDTRQGLLLGGDSGSSLVPGDLEESPMWSAINYDDYAMPPNKKLSASIIEDFRIWIEAGAPDPRVPKASDITIASTVTAKDIKDGRKFWSFQPPKPVLTPEPTDRVWARGAIDYFVLDKLEQNHLKPAGDADAHTLLRRLCFDLIGLPPSPEQIEWFSEKWEEDPDAAVAKAVDKLLADPGFGDRWGRHWLDLARFAESTGKEINSTYPHAWRYRDYVIDSFNEDKPYDRFVQEQIAGDLLPVKTDEQWAENLVATGFLAMGPKSLNETNPRQFRADLIDEQIDVSTRVVLGVSVACARCHDHKFDPIPQSDYYAMAGIFGNTNTYYGTLNNRQNRRSSDLILLPINDPNDFEKKLTKEELAEVRELLADAKDDYRAALQARRQARQPGGTNPRNQMDDEKRVVPVGVASNRVASFQSILDTHDEDGKPKTFCMGVQPAEDVTDASLLIRGEVDQPGEVIPRGFVQVIGGKKSKVRQNSSGRLELARWMTDDSNPLTARVMTNRIWQHLIGQGLVETTENFGSTGIPPTHPELLDYLALRFVDQDWSIKSMIREIATSRTYRMSSKFNASNFESDPENKLVWRASPRRLEAEAIRDAMLSLSGKIDLNRPRASEVAKGGTTIARNGRLRNVADAVTANMGRRETDGMNDQMSGGDDKRSRGMRGKRRDGDRKRGRSRSQRPQAPTSDPIAYYRSVYLPVVRDSFPRALSVFDFAESSMVVGRRETSNTPDQGLFFLNNPMVIELSKDFAIRLTKEASSAEDQIKLAFLTAYGRPATESELSAALEFHDGIEPRERGRNAKIEKLAYVCQSIMAAAEFRIVN